MGISLLLCATSPSGDHCCSLLLSKEVKLSEFQLWVKVANTASTAVVLVAIPL